MHAVFLENLYTRSLIHTRARKHTYAHARAHTYTHVSFIYLVIIQQIIVTLVCMSYFMYIYVNINLIYIII